MEAFLKYLVNGLTLGGMYALVALGYTMVYGIIKLINFAHGEVLMVGAFVGYFLLNTLAFNALTPLLLFVPLTFVVGMYALRIPTERWTGESRFVLSLAAVVLVLGVLLPVWGRQTLHLSPYERAYIHAADLGWRGIQLRITPNPEDLEGSSLGQFKRGGVPIRLPKSFGFTEDPNLMDTDRWLHQHAGTGPVVLTQGLAREYNLFPRQRAWRLYLPWAILLVTPLAVGSGLKGSRFLGVALGGGLLLGFLSTVQLGFAVLGAMAYSAVLGVGIERFAYKPLRTAPRIAALITAIGVSFLLVNVGLVIWGERDKSFSDLNPAVGPLIAGSLPPLQLGPIAISVKDQLVIVISLTLMLGLDYLVHRTRIGRAMRAVSQDRDAARLMGIDVDATISATFAIGSALAAAAGVLWAIYYNTLNPDMGTFPGIKAFVAAVLGGIGSIPGAMAGGIIMGVAENLVVGYLASSYRDAIAFAILIVILLVRPNGLFGTRGGEKV